VRKPRSARLFWRAVGTEVGTVAFVRHLLVPLPLYRPDLLRLLPAFNTLRPS
jgi:hypothetical protein